MVIGSSNNPCSETYAGPRPFSEPETRALAAFITSLGDRVKAYISLHAYGQFVLFPHGHTAENAPNFEVLNQVGNRTGQAISKRFGTAFTVGPPAVILCKWPVASLKYIGIERKLHRNSIIADPTSGASQDWAYEQNISLSYTFELRDKGQHGFILPADQIVPTARELLDGFIELVKAGRELKQL